METPPPPPPFFFGQTSLPYAQTIRFTVCSCEKDRRLGKYACTHTRMDVTPLDPHYFPSRIDDDERDNQLTHKSYYFFLIVLAGPIPRRAPGHHVIRLFETVRHTNFSPAAFPFPSPSWVLFFCASSKSLDSDAFGLHISYTNTGP